MININPSDKYYSILLLDEDIIEGKPYKIFGNNKFYYFIYDKRLIIINKYKESWSETHVCKIICDEKYRLDYEHVQNNIEEILNTNYEIIEELECLKNSMKIDIVCNNVIINLAKELKNILEINDCEVKIYCLDNLSEYKVDDDRFIFMVTPQHYYNNVNMSYLENIVENGKCMFYFMEQLSSRIDDSKFYRQYMGLTKTLIESSIISFDYNRDNLQYFYNIHYLPPPIITNNVKSDKIYDILFIGLVNENTRRKQILDNLKRYFKIKIVYNVNGINLTKLINQSKVILNLHYYNDNTLLEEVRLNEIINSDTHILSELPHIDVENMKVKYGDRVTFINIIEKPNKPLKKSDPIVYELRTLLKKCNEKYDHKLNNDITEKVLIHMLNMKTNTNYDYSLDHLNYIDLQDPKILHRIKCLKRLSISKNIVI